MANFPSQFQTGLGSLLSGLAGGATQRMAEEEQRKQQKLLQDEYAAALAGREREQRGWQSGENKLNRALQLQLAMMRAKPGDKTNIKLGAFGMPGGPDPAKLLEHIRKSEATVNQQFPFPEGEVPTKEQVEARNRALKASIGQVLNIYGIDPGEMPDPYEYTAEKPREWQFLAPLTWGKPGAVPAKTEYTQKWADYMQNLARGKNTLGLQSLGNF